MMRSLYSAVSGLKTHQTRMDVIGNNIANVNTEAFKSSRVTFTEIMYQTTASASGGNAATGVGGINAKQIGLGVSTGATTISITTAGAAETTGNPFDLKLTDSESTNFFIVSDGVNTFFTRSGSYYVDGNGFLCMTSTGYTLMGWQVDPTTGEIKKDTVSPLQVMSALNQTSAPEATTLGAVSGILDKNDTNVTSDDGYAMTLNFYDDLGYSYTARMNVKPVNTGDKLADAGKYVVSLTDVLDANGTSIIYDRNGNLLDPDVTPETLLSSETLSQYVNAAGLNVYRDDAGHDTVYALNVETANSMFQANDGTFYALDALDPGSLEARTPTYNGVEVTAMAVGSYYYYETPVIDPATGEQTGVTKTVTNGTVTPYYADASGNQLIELADVADGEYYYFEENNKVLVYPANEVVVDATTNQPMVNGQVVTPLEAGSYQYYTNENGTMVLSERYIEPYQLIFDANDGTFISIGGEDSISLKMSLIETNTVDPVTGVNSNFSDIAIDFTGCKNLNNGGTSTMGALKGINGDGAGKKLGALTGLSVDTSGKVFGSYDNGNTVVLCQIAVAQFSNASGLEKVGDNCYQTTLNSGDFDGIGVEITADGSSISTGELEMSNVDLSAQFTDMIITQRGFQANSRVITTSDTLLEELINLKR